MTDMIWFMCKPTSIAASAHAPVGKVGARNIVSESRRQRMADVRGMLLVRASNTFKWSTYELHCVQTGKTPDSSFKSTSYSVSDSLVGRLDCPNGMLQHLENFLLKDADKV